MIGNSNLIGNLDDSVRTKVKLRIDNILKVMGKGMVHIFNQTRGEMHIWDLYYALGLKHNIISVGQLTQKGYNVIFKGDDCFIYDKSPSKRLISRVNMTKNRMYHLVMNYGSQYTSFSQKVTCLKEFWLWHFRFGHLNFDGLKLL